MTKSRTNRPKSTVTERVGVRGEKMEGGVTWRQTEQTQNSGGVCMCVWKETRRRVRTSGERNENEITTCANSEPSTDYFEFHVASGLDNVFRDNNDKAFVCLEQDGKLNQKLPEEDEA